MAKTIESADDNGGLRQELKEQSFGRQFGGPKLSDRVAVELQAGILRGEFEPGQLLPPEAGLCEAFGVSRSVIRDAIRTLAARGLVNVHQGRGTIVSEADEADIGFAVLALVMRSEMTMGDVVETRAIVEGQFLPLATERRTSEDCERAAEKFRLFEQAVKSEDWAVVHEQHLEFHLELIRAIRMPLLSLLMRPLHEVISLSSLPPDRTDPALWELDAHEAILRALEDEDAEAMKVAVERHFEYLRREPYPTWRGTRFRDAVSETALRAAVSRAS